MVLTAFDGAGVGFGTDTCSCRLELMGTFSELTKFENFLML